jgi:peptidoglycan/LPS O-acetylase OafA/YrhL
VTGRAPDRLLYIDALRGWAILLVLLTHAAQGPLAAEALHAAQPQSQVLALPGWLFRICAASGSGVHLFFVVSALSLALSAAKRREPGLLPYLVRRFWRIAPMFYAGIALYLALFGWGPRLYAKEGIGGADVALTLSFLHIWSSNALNSVVPGDWSVGVEVMFYLILPLLLMLGRTPGRLAGLVLGFVALAQAIHWLNPGFGPFGNPGFPSQSVVFLFGLAAAAIVQRMDIAVPRLAALLVFLFLVAGLPQWHLPDSVLVYHVQFAALAGLLCMLLHRAPVAILVNPILAGIGRISFSMYVLQFALFAPVFGLAQRLAGSTASGVAVLAVYYPLLLAATAACAAVTYAAIERPGMRLGRFLILRLQQRSTVVERPV